MRSISNLLSLDRVDHHELRYVLLALFGSCRGVDLRLYRYQKQALASYALLLVDAEDHIADVTVSDDFPESELRAILSGVRGKLLERQEIVAGQELLFSIFHSVPGHFSYRDVFQIVPVPEDAPRPEFAPADHPLVIQFAYRQSSDPVIVSMRKHHQATTYARMLNVLTLSTIHSRPSSTQFDWALSRNSPDALRPFWAQLGYSLDHWPDASLPLRPPTGSKPLQRVPFMKY